MSHVEIAGILGISTHTVQTIFTNPNYNFDGLHGYERVRARNAELYREARKADEERLFETEPMKSVVQSARKENGCTVAGVPLPGTSPRSKRSVSRNLIMVDEHLCVVYTATSIYRSRREIKRPLMHFTPRTAIVEWVDRVVLCLRPQADYPPVIFVVPSSKIRESYSDGGTGAYTCLHQLLTNQSIVVTGRGWLGGTTKRHGTIPSNDHSN